MSADRFTAPLVGPPSSIAFPSVERSELANGLRVWCLREPSAPVMSFSLLLDAGTSRDPVDRAGLASLVASLAAESAGNRDSLALADALARLGARLEVVPGADLTAASVSTLAANAGPALQILADVVRRPQFAVADFERVRELRLSRLRQASRVAATAADRALITAVFGDHPYGHGALGTTASVTAIDLAAMRDFWAATWIPQRATLIAAGDLDPAAIARAASMAFGDWTGGAPRPPVAPPSSTVAGSTRGTLYLVDRPGSPHAEVRVGHVGPSRQTADLHPLQALNAILGGQFTSRINRNLRETRAITYGARTSFELRRAGGLFSCDTSVDAVHAGVAVTEILAELRAVQSDEAVTEAELAQAKASLTRGYARHFETAAHLARALAELATHDLPDDTFDRFVPGILAVSPDEVSRAARAHLRPDEAAIVVVTDVNAHGKALMESGIPVVETSVEF